MEKLELKHLAPYLPYDLGLSRIEFGDNGEFYQTMKLTNDHSYSNGVSDVLKGKTMWGQELKPILRPLSDLKGNRTGGSVMIDLDCDIKTVHELWQLGDDYILENISYMTAETAFKNHLDIFGLIEKGLAIDLNSLTEVKDD